MAGRQCRTLADERAQLRHLGEDHRHNLERVDLVRGEFTRLARLHDQNAELFTESLDRNAEKGGIDLLPGLGHVAEPRGGRRIRGVDDPAGAGDAAHEALTEFHTGLVDGFGFQTLGRAQLERVIVAKEIDGAHFGAHRIRRQMGDLVEPRLTGRILGHRVAQSAEELAALAF